MKREIALFVLSALGASCSTMQSKVEQSEKLPEVRRAGYRIAVMPFSVSASRDNFLDDSLAVFGSLLALEGLTDAAPPHAKAGTTLRRIMVSLLSDGPFAVEELWATDTELAHRGISEKQAQDPANAKSIAEILQVDGVLYGDVTEWNRDYYGLQSTSTVALLTRLIDATTGETLFSSMRLNRRAAGLTGGPTGQSSVVTGPIQGLAGSHLARLAASVAYDTVRDLVGAEPAMHLDASSAQGNSPRLSFASFTRTGSGPLAANHRLTVIATGPPGHDVRFSIGRYRRGIPMLEVQERTSARGSSATYVGHYIVQPGERVGDVWIDVEIRDPKSNPPRTSRRRITSDQVSISALP